MALKYWIGKATAAAQVGTVQITAVDGTPADNTFILTVGDQTVSAVGDTDVNTTATALAAAWNASTHAYFTGVTAGAATDTVTLTADTAGVPFVAVASVTGSGSGTIGAYSATTASSGPNDWSSADNWSGAAVPVNDDDVVLRDSSVSVAYGLDQSAVELDSLTFEKTYTGRVGLDYATFATSADGTTTVDTDVEYRPTLLEIDTPSLNIRRHNTTGTPAGSGRIRIDLGTVACEAVVEDTAQQAADTGRSAVQINAASASTNIYIESAPGGVGIGTALPNTTSTVGSVSVSAVLPGTRVLIGAGTTITTYSQSGGTNTLQAAATVTTVTVNGGELATDGDFLITTLAVNAGKCYPNNIPAAGNAITTLNHNGGIVDSTRSSQPRTWATVNMDTNNPTLIGNSNVVTITTLNEPSGPYILTASE
jgi:hypothetical protein